jgi:flagellar biosynthesis chaperone FliJ
MVTRPDTTRESVNEAASEAIRATSEASRRTLQSAQDAMRTARTYLEESTEANRKLFNAYAQGIEAAIKGGFEVQNAIFAAGMSFLDASINSSRNVVQQWTEATQQAQQATLEVWQVGVGAGDRLLASASSGEMSGQDDKGRKRK